MLDLRDPDRLSRKSSSVGKEFVRDTATSEKPRAVPVCRQSGFPAAQSSVV
jgi:hypothetical protein